MSSKLSPAAPAAVNKREFRQVCGRFATGITVATVIGADGEPHGMTANSFTSVSAEPPLVLVCVDHSAKILQHFRRAAHFGINVLGEGQQALSAHFARSGHDRFDGTEWYAGETGVPLLPGVLACLECSLFQSVDAGDHAILIGQVERLSSHEGKPLVYFGSAYQRLA